MQRDKLFFNQVWHSNKKNFFLLYDPSFLFQIDNKPRNVILHKIMQKIYKYT